MATVTEAVRRLRIEATSTGVKEATRDAQALAGGMDQVAVAAQRQGKAMQSAERGLNSIQRRYDATYRAQQELARVEATLRRAQEQGLVSQQRRIELQTAAAEKHGLAVSLIGRETAETVKLNAANARAVTTEQARAAAARGTTAAMQAQASATRAYAAQTRQLSFQLVDIGQALPQLALGGRASLFALQNIGFQVAQIGQLYAGQGGLTAAIRDSAAMVGRFIGRFTPLIALVGAGAAAWVLFNRETDQASAYTRKLASEAASLDSVTSSIGGLQSVTDAYARAIRDTAKDQTLATNSIIADSKREFEAKRSLLELELKRQQALVETNRLSLQQRQAALREQLQGANATLDLDLRGQGVSDPRIGQFTRSRAQGAALDTLFNVIDSGAGDELKKLRADLELSEVAANRLADALKVTFEESVRQSESRIARTGRSGKTEAERLQDRYDAILRDGRQAITVFRNQEEALGMTEAATARLTYQTELLNKAQDAGIELTAAQRQELLQLGADMAAAELSYKHATERLEAMKNAAEGAGGMLRGLAGGTLNFKDALAQAIPLVIQLLNNLNKAQGGAGIFGGGIVQSFLGGLLGVSGLADGGVLSGGALTPFAAGGVVTRPTVFPMANGTGLMGEAGPEAIMPLRRAPNGRLGVEVARGANNNQPMAANGVTRVRIELGEGLEAAILDQANAGAVEIVRASQASTIDAASSKAVRDLAPGGRAAKGFQSAYGLSAKGRRAS